MTYCVAIKTDSGLIFASDSLTNAGIDHVSTYSKMHTFVQAGDRMFVLLASGNLATTQAVVKRLRDDCQAGVQPCLSSVTSLGEAVDYVGSVSAEVQRNQAARDTASTNFEASFIFGGQIAGQAPEIYMIYPQGNYIHESSTHPFLQIGETKYGKPILVRALTIETSLEEAAKLALLSFDATLRSNVSVGMPIDLLTFVADSFSTESVRTIEVHDPYWMALREAYGAGLADLIDRLPTP